MKAACLKRRLITSLIGATLLAAGALPGVVQAQTTSASLHGTAPANAQTGTTAQTNAAKSPEHGRKAGKSKKTTTLQTVIVTGAPTFEGVTRARASFTITAASREEMKDMNPISTAQVLQLSPGITVQPEGGGNGGNVIVNGFPSQAGEPFVTYELDGMPLYAGFNSPFKISPAISGVQVLQGGPSVVTGAGQFGVTANFSLRTGTATPSGEVGVTGYSEGGERISGFYGFPITKNGSWVGSVSGYWQRSDGVRNPQFAADRDLGFTATLKHDFDHGSLMFYWMYNREHDEWIADYPLLNPSKGKFHSFPGFPGLTGTVYSRASQLLPIPVQPCSFSGCNPRTFLLDMANGREANTRVFGSNLNIRFNDWLSLSNGFEYTSAFEGWQVFFNTGPNPEPLSAFITQAEDNFGLPNGLIPSAMYTTGGAVPLSTLVMQQNPNYNMLHHIEAADQIKLNFTLSQADTLTVGSYINISKTDNPTLASFNLLEDAKSHPVPITLALSGGGHVYQVTDSYGLFSQWAPFNRNLTSNPSHGSSYNIFAINAWQHGPWTVQGGARFSRNNSGVVNIFSTIADLDKNPDTLYNNTGLYLNKVPSYAFSGYTKDTSQFSAGVSYLIHSNWSVYARAATAAIPPGAGSFLNLPDIQTERIHTEEVGMKFANSWLAVFASAYHRMFYNQPSGLAVAQNGAVVAFTSGADARGLNLQGHIGPFDGFSMRFNGAYVDGHYTGHPACVAFPGINGQTECGSPAGKPLQQQPRVMYRLMPTYTHPTSWGGLRFWIGYEHTGNRFSDQLAQVPLGTMDQVSIGAQARIGDSWVITLRGRNVTDDFGVGEGNLRIFGGATTNQEIYGRTIQGHEYNLQLRYLF